ncbi:MAG: Fe(2+) transporter permease subunit FeoB [Gammaproteobacteria bacterium]|nr:Fe(2+) transporter permease subunit FeoB [Gammaproteobacteria bacterium]MBU1724215.1 Fe(2+) transporter permease subunit FeoB [Gammaproteobacteria bacterium]MBU2004926.1 Fe(2+) transporter permease subunit FeoB [Gammaproteobacteria bacterium]
MHREIALLGNPNAGKTTLFNLLTGARQRTGNWPGVTVERKEGQCRLLNEDLHVVDLPGTYSLDFSDTSADEQVARNFVQQHPEYLYINIVDASTLERGLYLTLQLRELNVPMIVLLNMMDVAERRGMKVDVQALHERLGCPVIPVSLRNDKDLAPVHHAICHYIPSTSTVHFDIPYHASVEAAIRHIQAQSDGIDRADALFALQTCKLEKNIYALHRNIEKEADEDLDFLLADARFDFATRLAQAVVHERGKISRTLSDKVDRWVLGSWTGVPIFLAMMYLLFLFSINLGGAFIDFFDIAVQTVAVDGVRHLLSSFAPEWLITLLADGLGGGLQVVATFIPIIAALYLFLTLLEESGYMARAAFVMDQFMRKLGVSGKAFVPLIVGFGCNVPAIMATRTLDSPRERILTVLMAPFMSCGARLAVYALFAAAFFQTGGQNIVFLLYLTGIAFAVLTGLIMRKTLLQGGADHFVMEMPTYQIPGLRNILLNTWNKLKGFVVGAGKLIVLVVMVINVVNSLGTDGSFGNQNTEKSVLSATAKAVTPIFSPMGLQQDNWPATVGIVSGLLAKEVVVGTLDALYGQMETTSSVEASPAGDSSGSLAGQAPTGETGFDLIGGLQQAFATIPANVSDALGNLGDPLGFGAIDEEQEVSKATFAAMNQHFDGKIGAFAYLLFILMYFPCVAATGAMYREVGSRWAALGVAWSTGLGYGAAVLFYQLATFARHPLQSLVWVVLVLGTFALAVYAFHLAGRKGRQPPAGLQLGVS